MGRFLPQIKLIAENLDKVGRVLSHTFEGKPVGDYVSEATTRRRKRIARTLYNFSVATIVALLLVIPGPRNASFYSAMSGEVVEQDIIAPLSTEIEPKEVPALYRREISRKIPPVFDYDDSTQEKWMRDWQQVFRSARDQFYSGKKISPRTADNLEALRRLIYETTSQTVSMSHLTYLHERAFSVNVERLFLRTAERLSGRIITNSDIFPAYYSTGIILRHVNHSLREIHLLDLSRVWSIEQAQQYLATPAKSLRDGNSDGTKVIVALVGSLVPANLGYNASLTQKRIEAIVSAAKPPTVTVKTGQVLVQRGERLSDQQSELISNLRNLTTLPNMAKRFVLSFLVLFVFFTVLFRTNYRGKGFWYLSLKDCIFFLIVTTVTLIGVKFSLPVLKTFLAMFDVRHGVEYLLPLSMGAIIVHLMLGKEAGHTFAVLISVVTSFMLDQNFFYTIWAFAVMVSAIQSIRSCKQRTDLYKCGAWSGLLAAVLVFSFSLLQSLGFKEISWTSTAVISLLSFLSAFFATVMSSTLIPILESIAGYTTSLKLLELSNFNHPLLHTLMMKAPGTYHHSVIVGSLAEVAADRINANGLLARVSAYYHDIGKMNKPLYFIENQSPNDNPHDHLAPNLSAKILFSHVKNGVRLGREYKLGSAIIDIIEQHHGTTLVSYFFNKAKQMEDKQLDPAEEANFRYPGPRPQTREAAIVMLADACEAATRSIPEPTPAKIQGMVRSIINRRFLEEQFHQCELTFHDLQIIEEHFTRTLVSLYHHRIEYPGQKKAINQAVAESEAAATVAAATAALAESETTPHKPSTAASKK